MIKKSTQTIASPHKLTFPQLMKWGKYPTDFLEYFTKRYGDIYTIQFPGDEPVTIVNHPQGIQDIFSAPLKAFSSDNEMFRPVMGDYSLIVLNGKAHQRQRKLIAPSFHGQRMRLYGELICELAEQMMQSWQVGQTVDITACTKETALNALLDVVFGLTGSSRSGKLRQKILEMTGMATSALFTFHLFFPVLQKDWGMFSPWGHFQKLQREVNQLLYEEINRRRDNPHTERTDILSMLMAARDEDGQPMSNQELRDELITMLLGGFDTTASALSWVLYWIHQLPEIRKRLLAELDSVPDPSDFLAIAKLPYLSATCQESLRITPSIILSFVRVAEMPIQVMGHEFPVGSRFWADIYTVQRRNELYPEPEKFKPERFMERQFSPYEYLPFGGGNRLCIGNAFAKYLIKLVVFKVLSQYELALADQQTVRNIRRGPGFEPAKPIKVKVMARRQSKTKTPVLV